MVKAKVSFEYRIKLVPKATFDFLFYQPFNKFNNEYKKRLEVEKGKVGLKKSSTAGSHGQTWVSFLRNTIFLAISSSSSRIRAPDTKWLKV